MPPSAAVTLWTRARLRFARLGASAALALLAACGGGGGAAAAVDPPVAPSPVVVDARLAQGDAGWMTVLNAVPASSGADGSLTLDAFTGSVPAAAATRFKLWAPTAQKVLVFTDDTPTGFAVSVDDASFDAATGVWSAQRTGDLSGKCYHYAVEVFVRGTGLVRNLVTDPYSISLNTDSQRRYIASLSAAKLKPAGWDASAIPAKVAASTDLVVYELHVRDFSANDSSVSAAPENAMMGKLVVDSVAQWAREYKIASFRFDVMGHLPRAVMEAVQAAAEVATGRLLVGNQGYINGLFYAPNSQAGSIADYPLLTHWDATVPLKDLGGVGFALQPGEVVNHVENHDSLTLFDVNALKLPAAPTREDRARVQLLGVATVALSQGTAYFHAGMDGLRSKSLDRNSCESGDRFNRLDWSDSDNNYGVGLPRAPANGADWPILKPFLSAASAIKPAPGDIAWMRDAYLDLLKVRASTTLLAARVDGSAYPGANMKELACFINVGTTAQTLTIPALADKAHVLHPAQAAARAADRRVATGARYASSGAFTVPARSVAVFVVP